MAAKNLCFELGLEPARWGVNLNAQRCVIIGLLLSEDMRHFWLAFALTSAIAAFPNEAHAQYKNRAFGLDVGYWALTKPSILDEDGRLLPPDERPLRLDYGVRIGGESNFKMSSDHWWLTLRVGVGLFQFYDGGGFDDDGFGDIDDIFDSEAANDVGEVFGIEAQTGIRYVFLTDRVRPYLQYAVSYMRFVGFTGDPGLPCLRSTFCDSEISAGDAFLPTKNIPAIHVQPGLEFIVKRDLALHVFLDIQRWVRFKASDNWAALFGVGVNLFS